MKKIKTYVLIVSQHFPKTHPRSGELTEFVEKILRGDKIHTIRGNFEYWKDIIHQVKKGDAIISLRFWSGKPYDSKQIEFRKITHLDNPGIQRVFMTYSDWLGYEASVNGKELFGCIERESLSKNDGLTSVDFTDWFFKEGKVEEFSGAIIHFTGFRYENN